MGLGDSSPRKLQTPLSAKHIWYKQQNFQLILKAFKTVWWIPIRHHFSKVRSSKVCWLKLVLKKYTGSNLAERSNFQSIVQLVGSWQSIEILFPFIYRMTQRNNFTNIVQLISEHKPKSDSLKSQSWLCSNWRCPKAGLSHVQMQIQQLVYCYICIARAYFALEQLKNCG